MFRLTGIAIREASHAPMQEIETVAITEEGGLEGDSRGKPGKRQVTVLSEKAWLETCEQLEVPLSWATRRANLLISGVKFSAADVGKILEIGDVQLKIAREADPCKRMDSAYTGLKDALTPDWRGGVCCTVIRAGNISVGDPVVICE